MEIPALLSHGRNMRTVVFFLLLTAALIPARGAARLRVQEIESLLKSAQAAGRSDEAIARELALIEPTERLTDRSLAGFPVAALGPRTRNLLLVMVYASSFLDPPVADLIKEAPPAVAEEAAILARAREYASRYVHGLPDFICSAVTHRMSDDPSANSATWNRLRLTDTLTGQLSFNRGKESYTSQTADGGSRRSKGLTTEGEFGNILEALFLADTHVGTRWSHWEMFDGRRVAVFAYSVAKTYSRFKVSFGGANFSLPRGYGSHGPEASTSDSWAPVPTSVQAAYQGALFIEPDSGVILRLTRQAVGLGSGFPVARMDTMVDYRPVDIGGTTYVLPVRSVTLSKTIQWDSTNTHKAERNLLNEVRFSDYHKFEAESRITPGDVAP